MRLDLESRTSGEPAVFRLSEVVAALQGANPGVVAVAEGQLVGAAVGRVDGDRAWVLRVALHPAWRNLELGTALLSALEQRMRAAGAVLPEDETGAAALVNSGFRLRRGLSYCEKVQSVTAEGSAVLSSLGATVPPAGLWERLAGWGEVREPSLVTVMLSRCACTRQELCAAFVGRWGAR
ncbi:GNAT family N-acetyltransferase [Streptomyces bacillaris]|uniref:GNAT family N-acetyltransferase n=1 Tax=Streptomyces bacillaris TaxID=68179 RepID=UPI00296F5E15